MGKSVLVFSYPVGGADSYNDKTTSIIKRAGYRFALTYQNGVEAIGKINPKVAVPMHCGDIVGTLDDRNSFKSAAKCPVVVLDITT